MPEQLHDLQEILILIKQETDPDILFHQFHLRDNLTLLLLLDDKLREELESLLDERFQKSPEHEENFQYCGAKDYHYGQASFRYQSKAAEHGPFGVSEFVSQTGLQPNVNARIAFHNIGVMNHDAVTLAIKSEYLEIVQQLINLRIPILISRQNAAFNPTTGPNPAIMNA